MRCGGEEHVSARGHFLRQDKGQSLFVSEPCILLGAPDEVIGLAEEEAWTSSGFRPLWDCPLSCTCIGNPSDRFRMVGRAAACLRSPWWLVTEGSPCLVFYSLAGLLPAPSPQGSSRAAGRARPPAASEASLRTDFPLAAPIQKQGSKLRGMGTKVSLEENYKVLQMAGTTEETVKAMQLERT